MQQIGKKISTKKFGCDSGIFKWSSNHWTVTHDGRYTTDLIKLFCGSYFGTTCNRLFFVSIQTRHRSSCSP